LGIPVRTKFGLVEFRKGFSNLVKVVVHTLPEGVRLPAIPSKQELPPGVLTISLAHCKEDSFSSNIAARLRPLYSNQYIGLLVRMRQESVAT
jgi:hypothetical protein